MGVLSAVFRKFLGAALLSNLSVPFLATRSKEVVMAVLKAMEEGSRDLRGFWLVTPAQRRPITTTVRSGCSTGFLRPDGCVFLRHSNIHLIAPTSLVRVLAGNPRQVFIRNCTRLHAPYRKYKRPSRPTSFRCIGFLKRAVDLYSGAFCDDCYYSWLEPVRDEHRAKFIRASARLANLYMEFGMPTEALLVLDEAIREEPVNGDLYRRAITIEGQLRHRNNVIRRFNKLEAVLQDELDEDPDEDTAQLVRKVLSDLDRSQPGEV